MSKSKQVTEFYLVGQLLGFIIKDGYKIKYLRMNVSEREYWIKLSKEMRSQLNPEINPGCWLEIGGTREVSYKNGKMKLEADKITLVNPSGPSEGTILVPPPKTESPAKAGGGKACVLVCKKSACQKRGGAAVCHRIEEELRDRGLSDQVQVKLTGCLKLCKKGPNVVMMPDKARYSHVKPQQVPELVEKHLVSAKN